MLCILIDVNALQGVQDPDSKSHANAFQPEEVRQTPEVALSQEVEFERQGSLPPVKTGVNHAGAASVSSGSPAFGRGGHVPSRVSIPSLSALA